MPVTQAAALIQNFEWKPPPGHDSVEVGEVFGIAVSPKPFEAAARSYVITAQLTQSYTSKGIGRRGIGSLCKEILCFITMPCLHMPLLVHV